MTKKYRIIAEVYADNEEEALEEVGYRITVHRTFNSIADRLERLEVEEVEDD